MHSSIDGQGAENALKAVKVAYSLESNLDNRGLIWSRLFLCMTTSPIIIRPALHIEDKELHILQQTSQV
jgi:hypothetical protein